jgi:hypothetical protein
MTKDTKPGSNGPDAPDPATGPRTSSGVTDGNLAHSMELRDFMQGLGYVFQLHRKQKAAASPPAPTPIPPSRSRPWVLAVGLAVVALAGYVLLRPPAASDTLPKGAMGHWVASDARYVDRGFDLDSASVVFHTGPGPGDLTRHTIRGIRVRDDRGKRIVTVDYALEDGSMSFAFWLQSGGAPVIRLVNQPDIAWRRAGQ